MINLQLTRISDTQDWELASTLLDKLDDGVTVFLYDWELASTLLDKLDDGVTVFLYDWELASTLLDKLDVCSNNMYD